MIFQQNNNIPSENWTHPPTSIVISDFWNFSFFAEPLNGLKHKWRHHRNGIGVLAFLYSALTINSKSKLYNTHNYKQASGCLINDKGNYKLCFTWPRLRWCVLNQSDVKLEKMQEKRGPALFTYNHSHALTVQR